MLRQSESRISPAADRSSFPSPWSAASRIFTMSPPALPPPQRERIPRRVVRRQKRHLLWHHRSRWSAFSLPQVLPGRPDSFQISLIWELHHPKSKNYIFPCILQHSVQPYVVKMRFQETRLRVLCRRSPMGILITISVAT